MTDVDLIPDGRPNAEELMCLEASRRAGVLAFLCLPDRERFAFHAAAEGLTHAEIAAEMGCSRVRVTQMVAAAADIIRSAARNPEAFFHASLTLGSSRAKIEVDGENEAAAMSSDKGGTRAVTRNT